MSGYLADAADQQFEPSREALDALFATRYKAARARYPGGIPAHARDEIMTACKISSRAKYFRMRKELLASPDGQIGQRKLRARAFVISSEMHQFFDPNRYPDLTDVHAAIEAKYKDDPDVRVPGYSQFSRICKHHAPTDFYRKKREGNKAGLRAQSEILDHSTLAGQAWVFDTKNLHAPVATNKKTYSRDDANVISVWDHNTGYYLAQLLVLGRVTGMHVRLVIAMAIRNAGGIAEVIVCDNGGENVAKLAVNFIEGADSRLRRVNSHHSNEAGKAERPHRKIERLAKTLPGYSKGPKDLNGDIPQPSNHAVATADSVKDALSRLRDRHNNTVNRMSGNSPQQLWDHAYNTGNLHLLEVPGAYIAAAAVKDPRRQNNGEKVISDIGVMLTVNGESRYYWAEYFAGLTQVPGPRGHPHTVRVRYWPDDTDNVEIFNTKGEWRATAEWNPDAQTRARNAARNGAINHEVRRDHQRSADAGAAEIDTAAPKRTTKKVVTKRTTRTGADAEIVHDAPTTNTTTTQTEPATADTASTPAPSRPLHAVPDLPDTHHKAQQAPEDASKQARLAHLHARNNKRDNDPDTDPGDGPA